MFHEKSLFNLAAFQRPFIDIYEIEKYLFFLTNFLDFDLFKELLIQKEKGKKQI